MQLICGFIVASSYRATASRPFSVSGQVEEGSLKRELVHDADFASHVAARRAIFEYIDVFYNRQRRHSSLGYVSPATFEALTGRAAA